MRHRVRASRRGAVAGLVLWSLFASGSARAAEADCPAPGSLRWSGTARPDPACGEAGIAPSRPPEAAPRPRPEIGRLPAGAVASLPPALGGEALLALPVARPGARPPPVELGPGARVAESYWSALLCAVVARVVGAAAATPEELVPHLPEGALRTPHSLYRTAAAGAEARATGRQDPYRPLQWALDELGIEKAWGRGSGSRVRIAVLDSAPDGEHPDLGALRLAPLEAGPGTGAALHGTLVAALLAATPGNGIGIAGIAPEAEVVAVPVCTPEPGAAADRCRLFDTLRGLDAAFELGARLVNLSLVGPAHPLLERALVRLDELGVVAVAAAGNEGGEAPRYPAAVGPVLAVAARDRTARADSRSNRGPWVDLEAPGVEILSAVPGGGYAFGEGSSLAATHVTGVLGLLVSAGVEPREAPVSYTHLTLPTN